MQSRQGRNLKLFSPSRSPWQSCFVTLSSFLFSSVFPSPWSFPVLTSSFNVTSSNVLCDPLLHPGYPSPDHFYTLHKKTQPNQHQHSILPSWSGAVHLPWLGHSGGHTGDPWAGKGVGTTTVPRWLGLGSQGIGELLETRVKSLRAGLPIRMKARAVQQTPLNTCVCAHKLCRCVGMCLCVCVLSHTQCASTSTCLPLAGEVWGELGTPCTVWWQAGHPRGSGTTDTDRAGTGPAGTGRATRAGSEPSTGLGMPQTAPGRK